MRYYHLDLLDWHRGELSSRRLNALVKHLPRDSAVARAVNGESADWSLTDYLLAAAVDQLAIANWLFTCVNSDDPPEQPEPVPRPQLPPDPAEDSMDSSAPGAPSSATASTAPPGPAELARFFG
ncbi:hypothetical protein FQU76_20615 [Streptomyces qinzhouensis]|uniref:Uncharacterized protein n=1 Tax=Streptomyces qinzhouensis TaxID=2599401 RepID=A0A5B8J9L5_9ACTN|nr:hypothetical protein FQU76_20615 [Streptomyces qinzhouensis]